MRKFLPLLILGLLALSATPTLAQRAAMAVTPIWRPGEQLTTLVSGSDFRYVDVQLQLNGNVQFWAMNMTCAFTPTVLERYNYDGSGLTSDPGDDIEMVTWGPEWGVKNTTFVPASTSGDGFDFDSASGKLTLTATRLGNIPPLGINGADYSLLLATVRLRVRDLGTTLVNTSATIGCSPIEFLDRDGRPVARARMARPPALKVRTGYQIRGQALLQATGNHVGTAVTCTDAATSTSQTEYTASNGTFAFGNSAVIREFGQYECVFVSRLNAPKAEFLDAKIDLYLNSATYFLLPVILKGGQCQCGRRLGE